MLLIFFMHRYFVFIVAVCEESWLKYLCICTALQLAVFWFCSHFKYCILNNMTYLWHIWYNCSTACNYFCWIYCHVACFVFLLSAVDVFFKTRCTVINVCYNNSNSSTTSSSSSDFWYLYNSDIVLFIICTFFSLLCVHFFHYLSLIGVRHYHQHIVHYFGWCLR